MAISDNIKKKQAEIKQDPQVGVDLKALAVKAIYGGMPGGTASPDWIAYMKKFAETPQELARLTTKNTDCHDYQEPCRAYLIGNGICLPVTEDNLLGGIEGYLDVTLQGSNGSKRAGRTKKAKGTRRARSK